VLDAKAETISCGTNNFWSNYVAFDTRNGGNTKLSCGGSTGAQIASELASGIFNLVQDSNVSLLSCGLVKCNYVGQNLQSLTFSFTLQGSNANLGMQVTASFSQTFSPRF